MRRALNQRISLQEMLLASICDNLAALVWLNTRDAQKGKNRPKPILPELLGKNDDKPIPYSTGAEFLAAWNGLKEAT